MNGKSGTGPVLVFCADVPVSITRNQRYHHWWGVPRALPAWGRCLCLLINPPCRFAKKRLRVRPGGRLRLSIPGEIAGAIPSGQIYSTDLSAPLAGAFPTPHTRTGVWRFHVTGVDCARQTPADHVPQACCMIRSASVTPCNIPCVADIGQHLCPGTATNKRSP